MSLFCAVTKKFVGLIEQVLLRAVAGLKLPALARVPACALGIIAVALVVQIAKRDGE